MMKRHFAIFPLVLAFAFVACTAGKKDAQSAYNEYQEEVVSEQEESDTPHEAPKKPAIFYQRLLERFCQQYYNDCFSRREYRFNSVIVKQVQVVQGNWVGGNIVSWEMMVKGVHSFEGMVRNHNDSPFEAFVNDLGDDNYEVSFYIKRYDVFGDEMEEQESATRTMTFRE